MTNDRELLELAAKAAGIDAEWFRGCSSLLRRGSTVAEGGLWNPLQDDGDALRLAVRLKLDTFFHPSRVEAHVAGGRIPAISNIAREEYDGDPYAATRRAIVRAAAEIGKEMK